MRKLNRKELPLPEKDFLGRWVYDEKRLLILLKKMPFKRQALILKKALEIISEKPVSKSYAIARALDCGYDDAGYYWRKKEIRV